MRRVRRIAIVVIFIIAAALTPGPDVFSQLMMAGPLLVLYETSVWVVQIFGKKEKPGNAVEEEQQTQST